MDIEAQNELYDSVIEHIPDTHYLTKGEKGISCRSVLTKEDGHTDLIFAITYFARTKEYYLLSWLPIEGKWYEKQSKHLPAITEAVRGHIQSWIEAHNNNG